MSTPGAGTGMKVNFNTISQAQQDVHATSTRIDGLLDDLRQYLAPLVSTWEGVAAADYNAMQARWTSATTDLNVVLGQISLLLGEANSGYQFAESTNAGSWHA